MLQEDLTCPVCLEVYRNPQLLSCGHNFCKTCLDNVKQQGERGRFRCPECRESHRCSAPVQKNLKLASISDNYRQRHKGSAACSRDFKPMSSFLVQQVMGSCSVPCDYCPFGKVSSTSATSNGQEDCDKDGATAASGASDAASSAAAPTFAVKTCLKCEVSMCPEHVKPHLELPAFRGHVLTEPVIDFWKRKCPDHEEMYQ